MCIGENTSYEKSNHSDNSKYITNDVHSFLFYTCVIFMLGIETCYIISTFSSNALLTGRGFLRSAAKALLCVYCTILGSFCHYRSQ